MHEGFDKLLRAWGRYYGERALNEDEIERIEATGSAANTAHPLARAMEFAPGKRSRVIAQRTAQGRNGWERRRFMARELGACGIRVVPMDFVDVVAGSPTRAAVFGSGETARPVPPEIRRVERAALDLLAIHRLPGLAVRIQYCTLGDVEEKAATVSRRYGETIGTRKFREALAEGRGWMACELRALVVEL